MAIIAAGALVSRCINTLWLDIITLAVVSVLAVVLIFEFLNAIYGVMAGKVFGG